MPIKRSSEMLPVFSLQPPHPWRLCSLGPKAFHKFSFLNTHTIRACYIKINTYNVTTHTHIHTCLNGWTWCTLSPCFLLCLTHTHTSVKEKKVWLFYVLTGRSCGFYDDILIKVITHNAGTVIRFIVTPSGVITTLPSTHYKRQSDGRKKEKIWTSEFKV